MRLVARSKLARMAGVSPAAITKACRKRLAPACHGRRLDLDHPVVREYLESKELPTSAKAPFQDPADIRVLLDCRLREIVDWFGTLEGFADYVDVRKKIAETHKTELYNQRQAGELIERELVRTHVFGALEAMNLRLLTDTPKTVSRRLYALALSHAPLEEAEGFVRRNISQQLRVVKTQAINALQRRPPGEDDSENGDA